jgi:serine/threonine protein kinase
VGEAYAIDQLAPDALLGKYEVVGRIAYGGMAEIYLARASGIQGFEKYVVLKRILPQFAANPEFVRMFLREARLAAALDHANIAHVYDIGEDKGSFFFTMEYLHGEDARWIVNQLRKLNQQLPLDHAVAIVIGAAAGLHFAHEKRSPDGRPLGIVHCDMSPSNIVVTYDGSVKIVDFGVAKITADPELSRRHSLKGKLAYMSPEQLAGKRLDRRSDLFSLGIVLYELTTGKRLFLAESDAETMRRALESVIAPPTTFLPSYPPALEEIVMRALHRDPEQRYQRGRDLQMDLEAFARERLQLSSAMLAEWMESTFGPKPEVWRTLPLRTAAPSKSSADIDPSVLVEGTAATRVVPKAVTAALAAASPGAPPAIPVATPTAASRRRWMWIAAALPVLLAAAGLGGWFVRRDLPSHLHDGPPGAAGTAAPVAVIADRGAISVEPIAGAPPIGLTPAIHPAVAQTRAGAGTPSSVPRSHNVPKARTAPGPDTFSVVFARRETEIRGCFERFRNSAMTAEKISVRFQVARDGHVSSSTVLPDVVAASPLGVCLAHVAAGTVFPAQSEPVAFRIPVTVQVQSRTRTEQ